MSAIIGEHYTSEDGDLVSLDRLESTRVFTVQLSSAAQDPISELEAVVQLNSAHPKRSKFPGLVVQRYVQRRTDNPFCWLVDVIYDFPERTGFAGWSTAITYGEETARRYVDLDGKRVGSRAYLAVSGDSPASYYANTILGYTKLRLADPEGNTRRREGMDVFVGATTLVLSRTVHYMTAQIMRAVDDGFSHRCNSAPFLAWRENELLLRNATIREEPGRPSGANEWKAKAFVYPVELHFAVRLPNEDEPEAWRTLRMIDTFKDQEGNESPIRDVETDAIQQDTYRRYHTANFYDLISLIEGGTIHNSAGGRRD